jgi:DNA-binding beta-propeller fold protein YncE
LRSKQQTWLKSVGTYLPTPVAVNPEGSLVAAKIRRNGKTTVSVYEVNSSRWTQIHEGDTQAMVADDSGNLYIAQKHSRILLCTFRDCPHSFETNLEITALALSPLDGMLYVATNGATNNKPGIYVYDPRTTSLVRYISTGKHRPNHIAIEP